MPDRDFVTSGSGTLATRRVWPRWAVLLVRLPLMAPLALVAMLGDLADRAFEWLDQRLPAQEAEWRPGSVLRRGS